MAKQPNILMIVTDHLTPLAIGAWGASQSHTPNIDAILQRATRFENAYTACPICVPARGALWTGRLPHQNGVLANSKTGIPDDMPTIGSLLKPLGYRLAHFGKTHDSGGLRLFEMDEWGSQPVEETPPWTNYYDTQQDRCTAVRSAEFLNTHGDEPYMLVADLNNPHDICLWIGDHKNEHVDAPIPFDLPPLPANFHTDDMDQRPVTIRQNCCTNFRVAQTLGWTEENFRYYLAAFYHYCRMADRDIGTIISALQKRKDADNTLIVFLSDHGEGMAAHGMVTKGGTFFEETCRVPLMFAGAGVAQGKSVTALTSLLDVVPTVCEMVGAAYPNDLAGRSLKPLLQGKDADLKRDYVVSTWHQGGSIVSPGRMIRTKRYKYTHWLIDAGEELYDLANDPGEIRTLVHDPVHADALREHRALLRTHCEQTRDPYFSTQPSPPLAAHDASRCPLHA